MNAAYSVPRPGTDHHAATPPGEMAKRATSRLVIASLTGLLFATGIALSLTDALYHTYSASSHLAHGQFNAAAQDEVWAMVDLLTLGIPIGPAAAPALEAAESAISLSRAGIPAASIWGYLTTVLSVANNGGGGSTSGGGGSSSSSGSNGPGQWEPETQNWTGGQAYQEQITGRAGQQYIVNGKSFDGWDGTHLLDAKDNYAWMLNQSGNWQNFIDVQKAWIDKAQSQFAAAGGHPIEWHFSQQSVANKVRPLVNKWVMVIYTPAK